MWTRNRARDWAARRLTARGFSLVELLVVMAIIGLLASVLVPNLIDALNKAKQRRTMTDMRGVGIAWISWLTDQAGAASAGSAKIYHTNGYLPVSFPALESYLRPTDTFFYAQEVPQVDAWGWPLMFSLGTINSAVVDSVFICSAGREGVFGVCATTAIPVAPFHTTDYDQDIVWADGYFVRWPEGLGAK